MTINAKPYFLTALFIFATQAGALAVPQYSLTGVPADVPNAHPCGRHQQKVEAVRKGHYDLFLIGDSITQTVGDSEGEWAPLKAVWDKHFAPRNAINLGFSGYRTEDVLWNLVNGELDQTNSPKVVTLLIGTNNTDDQHYKTVHDAVSVFAGTKAIVDLIRKRHPTTKILILRPFPCGGPGAWTPYHRKYIRSAKQLDELRKAGELARQLMDGQQVFWLDVGYVFLRPDGTINTDLMPDLIHPNAAGAEAWAQAIEPTLSTLMGDKPIMDAQPNSALVPVPRTDGCYDWNTRHAAILAAKGTDPKIVFIGDSITHYLGGTPLTPGGPFSQPPGTALWKAATEKAGGAGLNMGYGADWTQHVLWRIDNGELDGIVPSNVVLLIGANNVLNWNKGSGVKADDIVAGIRACIIRIRAKQPKANVILMAVLPCRNPATHPQRLLALEVNAGLKKLAEEAKASFVDIGSHFLDANGNIPQSLMGDAVHPTPKGYEFWTEALIPQVK